MHVAIASEQSLCVPRDVWGCDRERLSSRVDERIEVGVASVDD